MNNPIFSIVTPLFNEEKNIEEFYTRTSKVMQSTQSSYEIIFVNDGSSDSTQELVLSKCKKDKNVKLINFSRNFGHEIATTAGIDHALGSAVIIIDGDLQDPPETILKMIPLWKEGYQVIYARRTIRKGESWFKKITAKIFYRLFNKLTTLKLPMDVGDFRLLDRSVVQSFKEIRERERFVRGIISWIGFKQIAIDYVRDSRNAGETKYSVFKLMALATNAIVSFTYKPLRMAIYLGFATALIGFIYILIIIYDKIFTNTSIEGWTSLMAVSIFYNGIILVILGIIGEYIGRIFTESKHRPLYIIESLFGWDNNRP